MIYFRCVTLHCSGFNIYTRCSNLLLERARVIETDNPFPEGENIVLGETDPFLEDWNCAWSNGYPFAEAAYSPRGNGYVPGSQHGPRNRYAPYTDCRFPMSITQLGKP